MRVEWMGWISWCLLFVWFSDMKYVLVTGGVVSGLGKGVTASSIGLILQACGLRVTSIKIGLSPHTIHYFCPYQLPFFRHNQEGCLIFFLFFQTKRKEEKKMLKMSCSLLFLFLFGDKPKLLLCWGETQKVTEAYLFKNFCFYLRVIWTP